MIWLASGAFVVSIAALFVAAHGNTIAGKAKDAAVRSAGEAVKSAEEARKSRLATFASALAVKEIDPRRERWVIDSARESEEMSHPGIIEPNTTLHLPVNGELRLLVGAIFILSNEGDRTVEVQIVTNRVDDITSTDDFGAFLGNNAVDWNNQYNTVRRDGKVAVAPREYRRVVVRSGPLIQEWIDAGAPNVWTSRVLITARVAIDAPFQSWFLDLSAQLLTQDPQYGGQVRTLANVLIDTKLIQLPLAYP